MAFSLALIIVLALFLNYLFEKIKLPGLLGMLLLGVVIGPYGLNLIHKDILDISSDLRSIALIIILLRAGLGIKKETLKSVGKPAIKMSCLPGIIEGLLILFASSYLLGISKIEAGILGFILAAVSPAVIVPQMISFTERKLGTNKGIPTMILAGASIDDVVAITIFSTFLGLYGGKNINITMQLLGIPVSIILGIVLGILVGMILVIIFKKYKVKDIKKSLTLISLSIFLVSLEHYLNGIVPIASLLGVMTIGFILLEKSPDIADKVSEKLSDAWSFAEILLFLLVGAQVNVSLALDSGFVGIIIILIGLLGRSIGVIISLTGTNLNIKEKLFCIIAYTPKATVQAAIGAVPLASGVKSGDIILAIAVLAILITAPLGAFGIKISGPKLLSYEGEEK